MEPRDIKIINGLIRNSLQNILQGISKEQRTIDDTFKKLAKNQLAETDNEKKDFLRDALPAMDRMNEKSQLVWSKLDQLKENVEEFFNSLID